jgi:hypothetical protein
MYIKLKKMTNKLMGKLNMLLYKYRINRILKCV